MVRHIGFAVFIALALTGTARAQVRPFDNGNTYWTACVLGKYMPQLCLGYIMGSMDMYGGYGHVAFPNAKVCMEGVSYNEFRDVFEKYLRDNPQERHDQLSVLIRAAMLNRFSCKQ